MTLPNPLRAHALLQTLLSLPFQTHGREPLADRVEEFEHTADSSEHRLVFAASTPFTSDRNRARFEPTRVAFRTAFDATVDAVGLMWGAPDFLQRGLQERSSVTLPPRLEHSLVARGGIDLAYWCKESRIAYIAVEHSASAAPLLIVLGASSRAATSALCRE